NTKTPPIYPFQSLPNSTFKDHLNRLTPLRLRSSAAGEWAYTPSEKLNNPLNAFFFKKLSSFPYPMGKSLAIA
ncbi:hypothetical protein, partial [Saccharibacter floricola]|uniref:hypothetical protein n=1 Tax=Saccharibacter floricola TaxID=231053 RepID=UPI001B7F9440